MRNTPKEFGSLVQRSSHRLTFQFFLFDYLRFAITQTVFTYIFFYKFDTLYTGSM